MPALQAAVRSSRVLRIEMCSCQADTLRVTSFRQETAAAITPPTPFSQIQFQGGSPGNPLWEYFSEHKEGPLVHKWCAAFCVYVVCVIRLLFEMARS
jgi:hypothetical protein